MTSATAAPSVTNGSVSRSGIAAGFDVDPRAQEIGVATHVPFGDCEETVCDLLLRAVRVAVVRRGEELKYRALAVRDVGAEVRRSLVMIGDRGPVAPKVDLIDRLLSTAAVVVAPRDLNEPCLLYTSDAADE